MNKYLKVENGKWKMICKERTHSTAGAFPKISLL